MNGRFWDIKFILNLSQVLGFEVFGVELSEITLNYIVFLWESLPC